MNHTSVSLLLERSSSTRFVRPRKAFGSTDIRLHLAQETLCRLIKPRREKCARPKVGMSFPETFKTWVFRSTVVGMDASVWLEQSTVILESLQMHWHFRGQVLAAAIGRKVVVGKTIVKIKIGITKPETPDACFRMFILKFRFGIVRDENSAYFRLFHMTQININWKNCSWCAPD